MAGERSGREKGRRVGREEARLWRAAMRETKPLRRPPAAAAAAGAEAEGAAPARGSDPSPRAERLSARPPSRVSPPAPAPPSAVGPAGGGLDRKTAERLRRGRLPIEARIDLHGYTLEEARRALSVFLAASRAAGKRCVLVVTGKGRPGGEETIRRQASVWLGEGALRELVVATSPAQPRDGGEGAFYALLRRRRHARAAGKERRG